MLEAILIVIISFIPAMIANSLAVIFGGGPPIDGGKKLKGERVLGDGKTWRGLFGGGISAGIVGLVLYFVFQPLFSLYPSFPDGLIPLFSLSFGALLGDIGASFIKRRKGKARGAKAPMIDMYDFLIGAFLLTSITSYRWFVSTYFYFPGLWGTTMIVFVLPLLHRGVNIIGYKLGVKKEPW
ncbi:MAG: CDP-2,3-bis-(O-geranylgeranyl)-sn-glycerol synthase [Candidatus Thermoplasmatota archaeon]